MHPSCLPAQEYQQLSKVRSFRPLWVVLREALLSDRDLQAISTERLQYTQLLYRWVGQITCLTQLIPVERVTRCRLHQLAVV